MKKETTAKYIWSNNSKTKNSTSSGAFFLIAEQFLKKHPDNSCVYGCAFSENNVARHIRINNIKDLNLLQGSKYVQSDTIGVYKQIVSDLKNGLYVLFSGTSCQAEAVSKFAINNSDRLYVIDVLCHGVPSPKLWREYINYLSAKHNAVITDVSFRNKSTKNRLGYILKYKANGITKTVFPSESYYYSSFINGESLRPSCYTCPFVGDNAASNITLADSNTKNFHPYEAISLLLIKDEKGWELLNTIANYCELKDADVIEDSKKNRKLVEATNYPLGRNNYYSQYDKKMLIQPSVKTIVINRIRNAIPTKIKDKVRGK